MLKANDVCMFGSGAVMICCAICGCVRFIKSGRTEIVFVKWCTQIVYNIHTCVVYVHTLYMLSSSLCAALIAAHMPLPWAIMGNNLPVFGLSLISYRVTLLLLVRPSFSFISVPWNRLILYPPRLWSIEQQFNLYGHDCLDISRWSTAVFFAHTPNIENARYYAKTCVMKSMVRLSTLTLAEIVRMRLLIVDRRSYNYDNLIYYFLIFDCFWSSFSMCLYA